MRTLDKKCEGNDKMMFETMDCTGCRTCEIGCSFHHRGVFSSSISSIEIKNNPKDLTFSIVLYGEASNGHLTCDGCQGLQEPFCIKYCNVLARNELEAILNEFVRK
jgi:Fe-S-cluster-containing hydrogenase component 2